MSVKATPLVPRQVHTMRKENVSNEKSFLFLFSLILQKGYMR